ncbi:hypothetical protein AXX17_AT1G67040 [Arabidopsis thaliana]|uniref:Uncharacterized protein n=1 Tax=Arabidopsis thaliana TaxID=3702 RepID=A0A178W1T7_ARATH|nr:hypothetical protein AXX17_AT1G67040 [Arabidopsis thaliana]
MLILSAETYSEIKRAPHKSYSSGNLPMGFEAELVQLFVLGFLKRQKTNKWSLMDNHSGG